jgi:acyl carrier protein
VTHEEIYQKVSEILIAYLRLDPSEIGPDKHIVNDIGADSLAMVELGFKFSEAFGIGMMTPTDDNMVIGNLVGQIEKEMKP